MKDSQPATAPPSRDSKYIKADNERFSTLFKSAGERG